MRTTERHQHLVQQFHQIQENECLRESNRTLRDSRIRRAGQPSSKNRLWNAGVGNSKKVARHAKKLYYKLKETSLAIDAAIAFDPVKELEAQVSGESLKTESLACETVHFNAGYSWVT